MGPASRRSTLAGRSSGEAEAHGRFCPGWEDKVGGRGPGCPHSRCPAGMGTGLRGAGLLVTGSVPKATTKIRP